MLFYTKYYNNNTEYARRVTSEEFHYLGHDLIHHLPSTGQLDDIISLNSHKENKIIFYYFQIKTR